MTPATCLLERHVTADPPAHRLADQEHGPGGAGPRVRQRGAVRGDQRRQAIGRLAARAHVRVVERGDVAQRRQPVAPGDHPGRRRRRAGAVREQEEGCALPVSAGILGLRRRAPGSTASIGSLGTKCTSTRLGTLARNAMVKNDREPEPLVECPETKPETMRGRQRHHDGMNAKCAAENARAAALHLKHRQRRRRRHPPRTARPARSATMPGKRRLEHGQADVERNRQVLDVRHRHQAARQPLARDDRAADASIRAIVNAHAEAVQRSRAARCDAEIPQERLRHREHHDVAKPVEEQERQDQQRACGCVKNDL